MKKILSVFALLFGVIIYANQLKAQVNAKIGVRLGYNLTTYSSYEQETGSNRLSLLGIYTVIPINKTSFSIQPEVLATQRGAAIKNVGINLSYIQVPVFARVDFANGSFLSPHLYLGPYIAFNIGTDKNYSTPINSPPFNNIPTGEENLRITDEIVNDVVYGLAIGLGVDINSFSFGIRFSQSIAKTFEIGDVRNTAISLLAAYHF